LIVVLCIFGAAGLFYWFVWRPKQAKVTVTTAVKEVDNAQTTPTPDTAPTARD
jgi:hypothetical protein